MGSRRKMTEREMKATLLNKKEDRVLEKTFGTLDFEKNFAKNSMSLHVRSVKANFRRLQDRVDKLKSNLSPEEMTMLRKLENDGKFRPSTSFNINATMKIAAASRRLSLCPEGLSRSHSFSAPGKRGSANEKLLTRRSKTDTNLIRKRSHSYTGVYNDAPSPDNTIWRGLPEIPPAVLLRPTSATLADQNKETVTKATPRGLRAASPECYEQGISNTKTASVKPTPDSLDLISPGKSESDAEAGTGKMKTSPRDKMAMINIIDESLDSGRTKLFEDRRQELLQDEHMFSMNLEKRKNCFIGRMDEFLIKKPPVRFDTPLLPIVISHSDSDDEDIMVYSSRRRSKRQYETERTFTTQEEYQQRERSLWKGINKIRYLRVTDDKIDWSGIRTLAKAQFQSCNLLKPPDSDHSINPQTVKQSSA